MLNEFSDNSPIDTISDHQIWCPHKYIIITTENLESWNEPKVNFSCSSNGAKASKTTCPLRHSLCNIWILLLLLRGSNSVHHRHLNDPHYIPAIYRQWHSTLSEYPRVIPNIVGLDRIGQYHLTLVWTTSCACRLPNSAPSDQVRYVNVGRSLHDLRSDIRCKGKSITKDKHTCLPSHLEVKEYWWFCIKLVYCSHIRNLLAVVEGQVEIDQNDEQSDTVDFSNFQAKLLGREYRLFLEKHTLQHKSHVKGRRRVTFVHRDDLITLCDTHTPIPSPTPLQP